MIQIPGLKFLIFSEYMLKQQIRIMQHRYHELIQQRLGHIQRHILQAKAVIQTERNLFADQIVLRTTARE